MRRFLTATLVFLPLSSAKAHSHSPVCDVLMSSPDQINAFGDAASFDRTDSLIVYLESLLEEGIMKEVHLLRFILGLENDRVLNPLENQEGSAAEIQGKGVQGFIDRGGLDQDRLLEWARQSRMDRDRIQIVRSQTQDETQSYHQKIEFYPVQVSSFQGDGRNKKEVSLIYPIEVMSTQVTQMDWVNIMGENPSFFAQGEHSMVIVRDGKTITLQPDHPVERVSWWSVLVFANRLSEKHGLKPAYDLSGISWRNGTSAKDGTLYRKSGMLKIQTGTMRVQDSDTEEYYYQAEGYRLPTEAEQEYLLRGGGKERDYFFGSSDSHLRDHAWYNENSGNTTHPVAELTPLILEGSKFYDLHGNVGEWGWDRVNHFDGGPAIPASRVVRGGGYEDGSLTLSSPFRKRGQEEGQYIGIGFRLVRTIGSPKKRRVR